MADESAHMSLEESDEKVLFRRFLGTITVPSWDLLTMMTALCDCRIESRVASSSAYVQIALDYGKPSPAGTADIAFSEA